MYLKEPQMDKSMAPVLMLNDSYFWISPEWIKCYHENKAILLKCHTFVVNKIYTHQSYQVFVYCESYCFYKGELVILEKNIVKRFFNICKLNLNNNSFIDIMKLI